MNRNLLIFIVALLSAHSLICQSLATIQLEEGEIKRLDGNWNLHLDRFLTYEEVTQDSKSVIIRVPGKWDGIEWKGKEFDGIGFGTYYIKLDQIQLSPDPYSIMFQDVGLSYQVYLDDRLIGGRGTVSTDPDRAKPYIKTKIYDLPPLKKSNYLIVHVANFEHENGGLWSTPVIGPAERLRTTMDRKFMLDLLVLGGILLMGIYHLYLYFRRPQESHGVFFFLICLCLMAQTMPKESMPLMKLFPQLDWVIYKKIEYLSIFTVAALNALFIRSLFPQLISHLFVNALAVISGISALFTLLFHPRYSTYLITPFEVITLLTGIYLVYVLIRAARAKMVGSTIVVIGVSIAFMTVIHDIMKVNHLVENIWLTHYGMFFYIGSLALLLAKRFTDALSNEEKLTQGLEELNEELEERVHKRTSELEKQKELVAQQNDSLKKANEEQKQLMAIVAHDLKSPLSKIIGYSSLMKKELKGELANMNQLNMDIARSGNQIIEDIVTLRSYEDERFKLHLQIFDIAALVRDMIQEFEQTAEEKSIQLTKSIPKGIIEIESDQKSINRIFDNLLSNAIKFSPKNTTVHVELNKHKSVIHLTVKDHGPGFTKEDKELVFGKFQKLSARPTQGENSTGLGLSIVKVLVDKLGGQIKLESEAGKGAEFSVDLPIKSE